jgi:hypothetical protein
MGLVGGGWQFYAAYHRAQDAAESLTVCRDMSTAIERLKQQSQRARLASQSLSDLAQAVEAAATAANLSRDNIVRIDPQALRQIGETDYKEQPTEVELQSVGVAQLKQFLDAVAHSDSNFEVRTLRLRPPHDDEASQDKPETWLAEVVLTQRIYAPKSTRTK